MKKISILCILLFSCFFILSGKKTTVYKTDSILKNIVFDHTRNFYDTEWNRLPFSWLYPNKRIDHPKPLLLNDMIGLAKKLSNGFKYARIDLYNTGGEIFFGEITFHSESGFGKLDPQHYDEKLGNLIKL